MKENSLYVGRKRYQEQFFLIYTRWGIDCSGRKLGSVGLEAVHACFQDGDVSFEGSDALIELGRESRIKQKGGGSVFETASSARGIVLVLE